MFKITIDKECGCFKRSDLENNQSFDNADDALIKATSMVGHMNDEFCQKHDFTLSENGTNFSIAMNVPSQAKSECCGGGHCS